MISINNDGVECTNLSVLVVNFVILLWAILFAATIFMYFEKRSFRVVKRIAFSPLYGVKISL